MAAAFMLASEAFFYVIDVQDAAAAAGMELICPKMALVSGAQRAQAAARALVSRWRASCALAPGPSRSVCRRGLWFPKPLNATAEGQRKVKQWLDFHFK